MILSAPRRFDAITPQSPTAPSPTTATVLPGPTFAVSGGVVAGAHHVGEREQRRHQRVVRADGQDDERSVRLRNPHRFALTAVDIIRAVPASVQA